MPTAFVRSRAQGDTKEYRSRPVREKAPCKKKAQTYEQTLEKARDILRKAAPSRVMRVSDTKQIFDTWSSEQLKKLFEEKHLVHAVREMSALDEDEVQWRCVRDLLKEGFLIKMPWDGYKPAPAIMS